MTNFLLFAVQDRKRETRPKSGYSTYRLHSKEHTRTESSDVNRRC